MSTSKLFIAFEGLPGAGSDEIIVPPRAPR